MYGKSRGVRCFRNALYEHRSHIGEMRSHHGFIHLCIYYSTSDFLHIIYHSGSRGDGLRGYGRQKTGFNRCLLLYHSTHKTHTHTLPPERQQPQQHLRQRQQQQHNNSQEIAASRRHTRCSFSCMANRSSGARAIPTMAQCWPATDT